MSHNGLDKPIVERLGWALLDAGLRPWFDKWDLAPGDVWIREVERILSAVPAVIVCVGEHGLSAWHDAERQAALHRATSEGTGTVLPVLLPGAPAEVDLPVFLRGIHPVDLRAETAWNAEISRLVAVLSGKATRRPPAQAEDDVRVRPYRGLQPFTEFDAGWMFGREREESRLLDALRRGQRLITIVGASGSGKSSLVRAGVVPAVRTGGVDGREHWQVLIIRPGARPCHALALKLLELGRIVEGGDTDIAKGAEDLERLRGHLHKSNQALSDAVDMLLDREGRDEQLLLVVDQFEEIFSEQAEKMAERKPGSGLRTHAAHAGTDMPTEGAAFLQNLLFATRHENTRIRVMLTVRADFTGECLAVPELARRMERMNFALPPMEAQQLHDAIRRPALRLGYDVEKTLISALVTETEDQSGRLPLLQHTLDLLWEARDRSQRRLTTAAYVEHVGSVGESVARRAEEVFAALVAGSPNREAEVRRVFLRLVHVGEGRGDTRRLMSRREVADGRAAGAVLDAFIHARLLVTSSYREQNGVASDQAVELVHEALMVRWDRLRNWLDENRHALRVRQDITAAATEWQAQGRPRDELWFGRRLARGSKMLVESDVELSADEKEFLRASESVQEEAERARNRARLGLFAGTIMGLALTVFAVTQYLSSQKLSVHNAELAAEKSLETEAARIATSRERGVQASRLARVPGRELEGLQLGVQAVGGLAGTNSDPPVQSLQGLAEALTHARRVIEILGRADQPIYLGWAANGQYVATAAYDDTIVRIWDTSTGRNFANLDIHDGEHNWFLWSADGRRLITASHDNAAMLWDGATGREVAILGGHTAALKRFLRAPDAGRVATVGEDGTIRIFDDTTGDLVALIDGPRVEAWNVEWSSDGKRLAATSEDGPVIIWDSWTGRQLAIVDVQPRAIRKMRWRPDGAVLATGRDDGMVQQWDGTTGAPLTPLKGHAERVVALEWAPDGTRLASVGDDRTVKLWDGKGGAALPTLEGDVRFLKWRRDGVFFATYGNDKTARIWDGHTGAAVIELVGHTGNISVLEWSEDGKRLATASGDGTVRLWDGTTGALVATLWAGAQWVRNLEWTRDGRRLATAGAEGIARLWDEKPGTTVAVLDGHGDKVTALAWSVDGTRLVTVGKDATARLWDGRTGTALATLGGDAGEITAATWAADGTRFATAGKDGIARIWDAAGSALTALHGHTGMITGLAWIGDGARVVTASGDGTARVWDAKTGVSLALLQGHSNGVVQLEATADGTHLATVDEDGIVRTWDGMSGGPLSVLEGSHPGVTLAWNVDGTRLFGLMGPTRTELKLWDGDTGAELTTRKASEAPVITWAWSPDGTRLATGGMDGVAKIWAGETGALLSTLKGHVPVVQALAWTPDGARLATAGLDRTAKLWDAKTGALLVVLQGHTEQVNRVKWTADGARLATAGQDGTLRLWDGMTGWPLGTLDGHTGDISALEWSGDGTRVATASSDGTARLWLASPRGWLDRACEILEGSIGSIVLDEETKAICATRS